MQTRAHSQLRGTSPAAITQWAVLSNEFRLGGFIALSLLLAGKKQATSLGASRGAICCAEMLPGCERQQDAGKQRGEKYD